MREIKFRGRNVETGKWVYGAYVWPTDDNNHAHIYDLKLEEFIEVDPQTVGQLTGLKDKNGKEIYEGDILAVKFNGAYVERVYWKGPPDAIAEVYFDYAGFRLNCHGEKDRRFADFHDFLTEQEFPKSGELVMVNLKHTEVIGNIYENPGLLKQQEPKHPNSGEEKTP